MCEELHHNYVQKTRFINSTSTEVDHSSRVSENFSILFRNLKSPVVKKTYF